MKTTISPTIISQIEATPQRARWTGMNCWEVTDSAGATFCVCRIVHAGHGSSACDCGGHWTERGEDASCAHIRAVEAAVEKK